MALQASGQSISFGDIINEFGQPPNKNFGAYRISETYGTLSNLPLDTGIPQSGSISFSQFYSKKLNIIVNFWSGGTEFRQNAKSRYNNEESLVNVVGKFTTRPANTNGKKVYIHVNKTIGSVRNDAREVVALRTGTWDLGTTLSVDVGGSGRILGAGGYGGAGSGNFTVVGGNGGNGNSGLGIQYSGVTINVYSGAIISAGGGGGGGGGSGGSTYSVGKGQSGDGSVTAGGGGGGGGAGLPAGDRGDAATALEYDGSNGNAGSTFTRGGGGIGGSGSEASPGKGGGTSYATGGSGGGGEDSSNGARDGEGGQGAGSAVGKGGSGSGSGSAGGKRGANGSAIRRDGSGSFSFGINSGSVIGSTDEIGVI